MHITEIHNLFPFVFTIRRFLWYNNSVAGLIREPALSERIYRYAFLFLLSRSIFFAKPLDINPPLW